MKFLRPILLILVVSLLWFAISPAALASSARVSTARQASLEIVSPFATSAPSIDGSLAFGEWLNTSNIPFDHGTVTVVNDSVRLYVLINVLADDINNETSPLDYFWLTFDVDGDGLITPNVDKNYGVVPSNGNMRYQYYLGANTWTGLQPETFSSRGRGFGCFFADGSASFSLFPFRFRCNRHVVWELAIDLSEIGVAPGDTTHMGFRVSSPDPAFTENVPANFSSSFTDLVEVQLAASPYLSIAPMRSASINLDTQPIEITQAIQTRDNTLALVADKTTAARVYVDVDGVFSAQPSKVYLYGSVGGVDLPGSPMAMYYNAPFAINRDVLNNTANFRLPFSWDQGSVSFSAKVADLFGNVDSSGSQAINFTARDVPTVWIVPINTGTADAPNLASNSTITSQEFAMEAVYPLKDISFVRKSWTAVGPTTVGNTITALNQYYNNALFAWFITVLFTGTAPFELPDQVYGFTPSGGGISDPTWLGANGRVARGFLGTSLELTMAHEINHNLDRSNDGTWGRHVPAGCGAGGPDPSWPYANDDIQETGFDTRLPWSDTAAKETAVQSSFPDFMSYCQSGKLPTKWISPYRWQNLFATFSVPAQLRMLSMTEDIQDVLYVSGQIKKDGPGSFDPLMKGPGIPSTSQIPGEYNLEVQNASGEMLSTLSFGVLFEDVDGEPVDTVYFNYMLPAPPEAAKVVLRLGNEVIGELAASANAPTVDITSPVGGETWDGEGLVEWEASDADGDPLAFTIQYSPDGGASWHPVAANLSDTSYLVDTTVLPGSDQGRIRVIVSDGFLNGEAETSVDFSVANNAPSTTILTPADQTTIPVGAAIEFNGEASDLEDGSLPDERLVWLVDGVEAGSGRSIAPTLNPGWHTISLNAIDSQDAIGNVSVEVYVGTKLYMPAVQRED